MVKRFSLLIGMLLILLSSTFASENASFFGGNPVVSNWDANLGTGQIDFSVGSDNANTIQAETFIYRSGQGYTSIDLQTGLSARDGVSVPFNIPSQIGDNKNGDYWYYIQLNNEQDMNEFDGNSYDEQFFGTYTGGNPPEDIYFLYGSPSPTAIDTTLGTISYDYYIGSDTMLIDITTEVEFRHAVLGVLETLTFTGQNHNAYQSAMNFDITTLGNYNGVYDVRFYSYSAGTPATDYEVIRNAFIYVDGVEYVAPILGCIDNTATNYDALATQDDGSCTYPVVVSGGMTQTTEGLPSVGEDVGGFLSGLAPGVTSFIFNLAIVSAIIGLIYSVVFIVKRFMRF